MKRALDRGITLLIITNLLVVSGLLVLILVGRIDATPILTHRYPLSGWRDAFLACHDQGRSGAVKVLFDYSRDTP